MSNPLLFAEARPAPARPDHPVLAAHREVAWRFDLLDKNDTVLAELDGVTGCSLSYNINATVRGGGTLTYAGAPIDWMRHRIQPWYTMHAEGQQLDWPLGVFIPATPSTRYADTAEPVELELYDKMHLLDQHRTRTSYSIRAGTVVTTTLKQLLGTGRYRYAVTDSTETLRTSMTWPAGTSLLRIGNDLLEAINYASLYADPYGVFRADPYVRPQDRTAAAVFQDDANSIYAPDFTREHDTFSVPNEVVLIGTVEGEAPAPVASAVDTNPGSPYSFAARGLVITHVEEGVDATSPAVLRALAARRLTELQRSTRTLQIAHLPVPITLGDVVDFRRQAHHIQARATVQTMALDMAVDALCTTTLREVAA